MRKAIHTIIRVTTAAVLSVAVVLFCQAAEHPPRLTVELEVFAANANHLLAPALSSRYKQGLRLRMASSLGTLRFLAREYQQKINQPEQHLLAGVERLRHLFNQGKWKLLARQSRELAQRYPLNLTGLQPQHADARAIASGRHIYQHLCMGCHEHPDTSQSVPAPNLISMAKTESTRELIARLIAGVHGTPAAALQNPFSDREIAGLAAYLKIQSGRHNSK